MTVHPANHFSDAPSRHFAADVIAWALPRLAVYVSVAIGSAVAFLLWGAVYTYIWPGVVPAPRPRVEQTKFDTDGSLRIREMPQVEVIVMSSGGFWGGVGEPTVSVAAPAVLNAIYPAAGKRYRSVPLMHEGIQTA